jgi:hypothetical protein
MLAQFELRKRACTSIIFIVQTHKRYKNSRGCSRSLKSGAVIL